MTFAKPYTQTGGTFAYNGIIPSNSMNIINNAIPKALDKTGDTQSTGGGISGEIDVLGTGSINFLSGSTLTLSGNTIFNSIGIVDFYGAINIEPSASLNLLSNSQLTFASGSIGINGTSSIIPVISPSSLSPIASQSTTGLFINPISGQTYSGIYSTGSLNIAPVGSLNLQPITATGTGTGQNINITSGVSTSGASGTVTIQTPSPTAAIPAGNISLIPGAGGFVNIGNVSTTPGLLNVSGTTYIAGNLIVSGTINNSSASTFSAIVSGTPTINQTPTTITVNSNGTVNFAPSGMLSAIVSSVLYTISYTGTTTSTFTGCTIATGSITLSSGQYIYPSTQTSSSTFASGLTVSGGATTITSPFTEYSSLTSPPASALWINPASAAVAAGVYSTGSLFISPAPNSGGANVGGIQIQPQTSSGNNLGAGIGLVGGTSVGSGQAGSVLLTAGQCTGSGSAGTIQLTTYFGGTIDIWAGGAPGSTIGGMINIQGTNISTTSLLALDGSSNLTSTTSSVSPTFSNLTLSGSLTVSGNIKTPASTALVIQPTTNASGTGSQASYLGGSSSHGGSAGGLCFIQGGAGGFGANGGGVTITGGTGGGAGGNIIISGGTGATSGYVSISGSSINLSGINSNTVSSLLGIDVAGNLTSAISSYTPSFTGLNITGTGLNITSGGETVSGGLTVASGLLTVSSGGASISGGLTISSAGAAITGGLDVVSGGATIIGGLSTDNATISGSTGINGTLIRANGSLNYFSNNTFNVTTNPLAYSVYTVDATTNAVGITLPDVTKMPTGFIVTFKDLYNNSATHNIEIYPYTGQYIDRNGGTGVIFASNSLPSPSVTLMANPNTLAWLVISAVNVSTF